MDVQVHYGNEYKKQNEFDRFFATAFDRYNVNRDVRIDYNEYQPLINDMCARIHKNTVLDQLLIKSEKLGCHYIEIILDTSPEMNLVQEQKEKLSVF